MKNVIDALKLQINKLQQEIAVEKEWNEKLNSDPTSSTIIDYRKTSHELSKSHKELDDLCLQYFSLITEYNNVLFGNSLLESNYTENYQTHISEEPNIDDEEEVKMASDEEIIKIANNCDNI